MILSEPTVVYLKRPTEDFKRVVSVQLDALARYIDEIWHKKNLLCNLIQRVEIYTNEFLPGWFDKQSECYEHKINAMEYLMRVKIYDRTRNNNQKVKNSASQGITTKNKKMKVLKNI